MHSGFKACAHLLGRPLGRLRRRGDSPDRDHIDDDLALYRLEGLSFIENMEQAAGAGNTAYIETHMTRLRDMEKRLRANVAHLKGLQQPGAIPGPGRPDDRLDTHLRETTDLHARALRIIEQYG